MKQNEKTEKNENKRSKKIQTRITKEELERAKAEAKAKNLSLSAWQRVKLFDNTQVVVNNSYHILPLLADLQTNANKMLHTYDIEELHEYAANIVKGSDDIWQYLR